MAGVEDKDILNKGESSLAAFRADTTLDVSTLDVVSFAVDRLQEFDPKHVIYVDASNPNIRILAGEVLSNVEQLSAGLKAHGVQAGDCVCIHAFNSIWYPLFWLAIIAVGGIVTGSNPAYTSTELIHHFKITDTKLVIAQSECLAAVKEAVSKCDISMSNVFVLGTTDIITLNGFTSSTYLWKHRHKNRVTFDNEELQDASIAVYAATSGTTGLPKTAELSHKYIVAQATSLEHVFTKRTGQVRQLICLPVFHAFAAQLAIVLPLRLGITTYFMPRFSLEHYLSHVLRYRITDSAVVPPIVSALLDAPPSTLVSLRYIICAGAPMTAAVQSKLYSNLSPGATIAQCWGATELGWLTLFEPSEHDDTGSVGRLLPNTTLKIIDGHGNPITTDDTHGEALIKSPSMFKQYRNNPAANLHAFNKQGYYLTGDRVFVRDNKVFIDGRIKDIMKVNGWQVSPEEIEHVVLELNDVTDCAVVGHTTTSKTGLEETQPRAFVVRTLNGKISGEEVQRHVSDRLVRYKRLSGGVAFIEKIPRSNTGKILRKQLLDVKAKSDGHGGLCLDDECGHVLLKEKAKIAWRRCVVAIVLGPVCATLGLPGIVLLLVGFRMLTPEGGKRRTRHNV